MYWSFEHKGQKYYSWGEPRCLPKEEVKDLKPRFDVNVYSGNPVIFQPDDSVVMCMQGSSDLGLGDSIWLINYMRDIYRLKARRRCKFSFYSSPVILNFYKHFLPSSFELKPEYVTEEVFLSTTHKLPAMYYWHDPKDSSDKSWVDNKGILSRLYMWSGMQYDSLSDWGEFTNEKILYPPDEFYKILNINKNDKFVYFQWHSSGHAKNLSPKTNIKLIKHIVKKYGYKVYVVGRLKCLDSLNDIPGVVNLSGKTEGMAEALFHFAFRSEFVVCPDSAGVHLAEAFKVPCVCILSTLPPSYICNKYKIPTFMYGSGHCPYKPCGIVHLLPKDTKCPKDTGDYCKVLDDIDLDLFDRCLEQSVKNRANYRKTEGRPFYTVQNLPITLEMV